MSKRSKSKRRDWRKAQKAKRKAEQRARYATYRDSGNNSKRRTARAKLASRWGTVAIKPHPQCCGNVACKVEACQAEQRRRWERKLAARAREAMATAIESFAG